MASLLLLLLALARADAPDLALEDVPDAPAAPTSLEQVWSTLPSETLIDEAVTHREQGDWEGAEGRLRVVEARGEQAENVAYQLVILDEMRERLPEALEGYRAVQERFPDSSAARDARFREALVLDDLGRHGEALRAVRSLQREGHWEGADAASLGIERGVAEIGDGRTRRGIHHVQAALDQLEGGDQARWMRARGRAALLRTQLDTADAIRVDDPKKAADAVLQRRQLITDAEAQRAAIAALGEPEYALEALLRIADSAMKLYDDVNAAPAPPEIAGDPDALRQYTQAVRQQSERFRAVAFQYYDAGVTLAERVHWRGARAWQLRQRRDALRAAMDSSAASS